MSRSLFLALFIGISFSVCAQVRIDSSFAFSINPAKKYSVYLPSGYNPAVPSPMVVGFHPLNVARWNAKSWCDTLLQFSEQNQVILICPDGDADGSVTDPIDYDFTTALIDSAQQWFNVNPRRIYALGFSVGGRAVYEYGLEHADIFGGYIPIGPAVNGSAFVSSTIHKSGRKPFYLVHGDLDAITQGYYPMLSALRSNCAIVDSLLMPGVAHTIDFPNRNAILGAAYHWVDSVNLWPVTGTFSLIEPISFSNFEIKGFQSYEWNFRWENSTIADSCGVLKYEVMTDVVGGKFSSPSMIMPSNNGGSDTMLTLNNHQVDSILNAFGVPLNGSLMFAWTVRSILHGNQSDTAKAFVITLTRKKLGFNLLSPAHNNVVTLDNGGNKSFDWEDMLHYTTFQNHLEIDDTAGNFNTPLTKYLTSGNGSNSFISLTHEQLYYDLMMEQGVQPGDSIIVKWSASVEDPAYKEFASTERNIIFIRGNAGYDLFTPIDASIIQSKKGSDYTFSWDSITRSGITYQWLFDTVGVDLKDSAAVALSSNNGGSLPNYLLTFETLDSILNHFNVDYLDTLHAQWTSRASHAGGFEYALNTYDISIYRAHPVGIRDNINLKESNCVAFPNPAFDIVNVRWKEDFRPDVIELLQLNGKQLKEVMVNDAQRNTITLDVRGIKSGMYVLRLSNGSSSKSLTLVIETAE